jgi:hypothetical protein
VRSLIDADDDEDHARERIAADDAPSATRVDTPVLIARKSSGGPPLTRICRPPSELLAGRAWPALAPPR